MASCLTPPLAHTWLTDFHSTSGIQRGTFEMIGNLSRDTQPRSLGFQQANCHYCSSRDGNVTHELWKHFMGVKYERERGETEGDSRQPKRKVVSLFEITFVWALSISRNTNGPRFSFLLCVGCFHCLVTPWEKAPSLDQHHSPNCLFSPFL